MSILIAGLFNDSKAAGNAVAELKTKGFTENISLVAKDNSGEVNSHVVKGDVTTGAAAGAVTGTALGALTGLIAGAVSAAIPGGVILVAGPLAAAWGLTGAAIGGLSGGVVGALMQLGFAEDKAKMFEEHILRGEVLVTTQTDEEHRSEVEAVMKQHQALDVVFLNQ